MGAFVATRAEESGSHHCLPRTGWCFGHGPTNGIASGRPYSNSSRRISLEPGTHRTRPHTGALVLALALVLMRPRPWSPKPTGTPALHKCSKNFVLVLRLARVVRLDVRLLVGQQHR